MITAIVFMLLNFFGYVLALLKGPYWGLLVYANIYFNSPRPYINWWASYLPFHNWSFISTAVILVSVIIHRKKLSDHNFGNAYWLFAFFLLTLIISQTNAVVPEDATYHIKIMLSYIIVVFFIIKIMKNYWQYRFFCLIIIIMAGNLSLNAFLYGKRINARLENIGTVDTFGSNQFSLLLVGIIPLMLPFIFCGKWYERAVCIISMPFILNAFILCNSRGSFIAFLAAIIFAYIFLPDKKMKKTLLASGIIAALLFVYLSDEYFITRISTLLSSREAIQDEGMARELSSGRTEIWMYGLEMVKDYPFGAGPNGFKQLARYYMPPEVLTFHPGQEYGIRAAHNSYLQILVEQGYLGLLIWLSMCIHTLYRLVGSSYKLRSMNSVDPFWKFNIVGLNISFFSVLVAGLVSSRVYYEFFWWQVALSVVVSSFISKKEENDTDQKDLQKLSSSK